MNNDQLLDRLTRQAIDARRLMLGRLLFNRLGGVVAHGPLKGFRLNEHQIWGPPDLGPRLLGLYEKDVLDRIGSRRKRWEWVINLGAGDGYYGIGLVKADRAKRSICFEQSDEGKAALKQAAEANGVTDRVTILGRADTNFLDLPEMQQINPAEALLIIDIEGGEFSLLTEDTLTRLNDAEMIIELHGGLMTKARDVETRFLQQLKAFFACDVFTMAQRDLSKIPEVAFWGDSDRWLLCSESRPFLMRWVHCVPKQKAA
jgi:hypothetical protein